jgi:hypothetical protein
MKFLFLYVCLVFFFNSYAQHKTSAYIIEDAIRSRRDVDTIFYDRTSLPNYYPISELTSQDKLEGYTNTIRATLRLSKGEIRFLDSVAKKQDPMTWRQDMFAISMILEDSAQKTFVIKSYQGYNLGKPRLKYFLFSKPVFIRNNNIAVFFLDEMYGPSSGYQFMYVYRRGTSGKWEQFMFKVLGAW